MKIKILNFIKEFQKIINNNKNNYVLISNKEDSQLKLNYYQFSVLIFKACNFLKKKKNKRYCNNFFTKLSRGNCNHF